MKIKGAVLVILFQLIFILSARFNFHFRIVKPAVNHFTREVTLILFQN